MIICTYFTFTSSRNNRCTVENIYRQLYAVLWIRDFLVQIRIRGSVPLTNGSESESCKFIAHQAMELRESSLFMFEDEAGYKFQNKKKKFWPVSDLDPNPGFESKFDSGFGYGFDSGFGSGFETNFRLDPDPKPDPRLLFRIRNTVTKDIFLSLITESGITSTDRCPVDVYSIKNRSSQDYSFTKMCSQLLCRFMAVRQVPVPGTYSKPCFTKVMSQLKRVKNRSTYVKPPCKNKCSNQDPQLFVPEPFINKQKHYEKSGFLQFCDFLITCHR